MQVMGGLARTVHVVVPTLNAAACWQRFSSALTACIDPAQVLIIDSQSTDGTASLAQSCGFRVHSIPRAEFDHGATRQLAANILPGADILVYLTQDAILSGPDAVSRLVAAFDDPSIAVAYGRQLPRIGAGAIESHARFFNYPDQSSVRDLNDRRRMGFKAIFVSNSFAAYRRSALIEAGGFPSGIIFGEDTFTAGKLLVAGYRIAYVAEAAVYHSHGYSWLQELKRYFDIGVLHSRERWLLDTFGGPGGEGRRFVPSELRYLLRADLGKVPSALVRTGLKYIGYHLGKKEKKLPAGVKRRLSMNGAYW